MDLQPTLTGPTIDLRSLRPADFPALFAAASDPRTWVQHPESNRYTAEGHFGAGTRIRN